MNNFDRDLNMERLSELDKEVSNYLLDNEEMEKSSNNSNASNNSVQRQYVTSKNNPQNLNNNNFNYNKINNNNPITYPTNQYKSVNSLLSKISSSNNIDINDIKELINDNEFKSKKIKEYETINVLLRKENQ